MTLDDALQEWSKWCWQGATLGSGYPPESCTEMMDAIQYKTVGFTLDEQIAYIEERREADSKVGLAVEEAVSKLDLAQAIAVRARYVYLPEADRHDVYMTWEQAQAKRAAIMGQFLRAATGFQRAVSVDEYEERCGEGTDRLQAVCEGL